MKKRVILRAGVVVAIVAAATVLHVLVVQGPDIGLGGGRQDEIRIWSTANYPVAINFTLDPSGRVDIYVDPLSSKERAAKSGRHASHQLPDNVGPVSVKMVAACGARFKPSSVSTRPEGSFGRPVDVSAAVAIKGGGVCGGYAGVQIISIPLGADDPSAPVAFSIWPEVSWTHGTLDQRVARFPWIYLQADVEAAPTDLEDFALTLSMPVRQGERLDRAAPASLTSDDRETLVWVYLKDQSASSTASSYGRWLSPDFRTLTQGLLVLSGVLFGVAATLAVEFLTRDRESERKLDSISGKLSQLDRRLEFLQSLSVRKERAAQVMLRPWAECRSRRRRRRR